MYLCRRKLICFWIYLLIISSLTILTNVANAAANIVIPENAINDSIFDQYFNKENTRAIAIFQSDSLIFEQYLSDHPRFSKDISSLFNRLTAVSLLQTALFEGYIYSLEEPVLKYLPELSEKDFTNIALARFFNLDKKRKYTSNLPDDFLQYEVPKNDTFKEISNLCYLVVERSTGINSIDYLKDKIINELKILHKPIFFDGFAQDSVLFSYSGMPISSNKFLPLAQLFLQSGFGNTLLIQNNNNFLLLSKEKELIILWSTIGNNEQDLYEFVKKLSDPG